MTPWNRVRVVDGVARERRNRSNGVELLVFHRAEIDVLFGEDGLHSVEHLAEVLLRVGDQFELTSSPP